MGDLVGGDPVQVALLVARPAVAAQPGARQVGAKAVRADQIGVEGDEIAGLDDARRAFLEPRIGARSGRQQPRLDPFAATRDVAAVQFGPQLVLGDAGFQRRLHLAHRRLAGDDRAAHAQDLVGRFDEARVFHHRFAIADRNAEAGERGDAFGIEVIGGDAAVSAAMLLTRSAMPAAQRSTRLSVSSPP